MRNTCKGVKALLACPYIPAAWVIHSNRCPKQQTSVYHPRLRTSAATHRYRRQSQNLFDFTFLPVRQFDRAPSCKPCSVTVKLITVHSAWRGNSQLSSGSRLRTCEGRCHCDSSKLCRTKPLRLLGRRATLAPSETPNRVLNRRPRDLENHAATWHSKAGKWFVWKKAWADCLPCEAGKSKQGAKCQIRNMRKAIPTNLLSLLMNDPH